MKDRPDGDFHVGYQVLDFEVGGGGDAEPLTVAVWYPTTAEPAPHRYGGMVDGRVALDGEIRADQSPYPLLVFSHGYGGGGISSAFLTEPLAARGWIVAAPDHHDRHSAIRIRTGLQGDLALIDFARYVKALTRSGPEDRGEYLYRLDEMKATLDGMLESPTFGHLIDGERIAVGGHSFGGFTALGLCGTLEERFDERIKGLLLFSTGAGGYLYTEEELAAVTIPSIYLYGETERDQERGSETMGALAEKLYRNFPRPKYLLEVKGAGHLSFNNWFSRRLGSRFLGGSEEEFEVIRRYSLAFLERHVAGVLGADEVLAQGDPMLTRYERASAFEALDEE